MRKVVALALVIVGCFAAGASAQFSTSSEWEVIDANKRVLGEVSAFDLYDREKVGVAYQQSVKPNWGSFLLLVSRNYIEVESPLYFDQRGCKGKMGIPGKSEDYILHPAGLAPDGTVYIMDRHADAFKMRPKSTYTAADGCKDGKHKRMGMMPVAPVLNVHKEFAPPYHLRRK